jgi:hypothetical protein
MGSYEVTTGAGRMLNYNEAYVEHDIAMRDDCRSPVSILKFRVGCACGVVFLVKSTACSTRLVTSPCRGRHHMRAPTQPRV